LIYRKTNLKFLTVLNKMASNEIMNAVSYELTNGKNQQKPKKINGLNNPLNEDPTFEERVGEIVVENDEDDLIEPIDGLKIKKNDRVRHTNRRYTRSCDYPEEQNLNNKIQTKLSASLPDHFTLNSSLAAKNWSKKFSKNSRRSRRERSRGLAKKGGNGKYNWGGTHSLVDVAESLAAVEDPSDINYESDKEDNCELIVITPALTDEEIERHVTAAINEYYEHGDSNEVAYQLEEYNFDKKEYQIIVIAVTLAMEHKSSHRELTSVLISDLYDRILKMPDYEQGFKILIKNLPDLLLDTPNGPAVLGNFIARAIADDCLPPCFVTKLKQTLDDPLQLQAINQAASLLDSRFSMMKLDSIWGESGGFRPVHALVNRIQMLLTEYISSGDIEEATRCLNELEVPHLHHHLIYEVVTVDQLILGFNQVYEEIDDISIDVPLAYPILEKLVAKCESFLPKEVVKKCPVQRGRKRFLSESDGKFKEEV